MNRGVSLLVTSLLALVLGSGALAAGPTHTFREVDLSRPLELDFGPYRARVDGWDRDYVELEVDGRALSPLKATIVDNRLRIEVAEFKAPLYEPAFRVKVPRSLPVVVTANELWSENATIAELGVKVAYVRDCELRTVYPQMRPLHPTFNWWTFRWHTDGWQVIRFK